MSLILEALKKSEAERQRRQTPGILTPTAGVRRRRRLSWLLLALLLPATLVGGWWLGQRGSDGDGRSTAAGDDSRPATSPAATTAATPTADPAATPPTPSRTAAPTVPPPTREVAAERREGPAMVAPAAADPLADPDIDDATRAQLAEALGALPEPPSGQTQDDRMAAAEQAEPTPRQDPSPRPGTPADESPPMFHELPFTLRRDLPEIRVTMIVSSADPSARFVMANGERRHEGDEVAPGVRLIGIAAQTLELEFRGQRFLLRQGSG